MIIPRRSHVGTQKGDVPKKGVYLASSHLCFGPDVLSLLGRENQNVFMAAYPEKGFLLVAPITHGFFPKLHPTTQHILKIKDQQGGRSIALHEFLIDQGLNSLDRPLEFEYLGQSKLLKIYLAEHAN